MELPQTVERSIILSMTTNGPQRDHYRLFIDESGIANPAIPGLYILAGCSVNKTECSALKILADQIKFKYWGRTDIVFHSREMSRCEGDFCILKDVAKHTEFMRDLENFLSVSRFRMLFIVVDKQKAKQAGWNEAKVYKDTTISLVRNFLLSLLTTEARGEMIIESASAEKDKYLLDAFAYFLGSGIVRPIVSYEIIQDTITSVSFVTKKNHDTEEQIADLFGYAAKLKYFHDNKISFKNGSYETMMLKLLRQRIFVVPASAGEKKSVYFKEMNPFLVLP